MTAAFERILRAYFKNRRFARNLALSRTPESRQNPGKTPLGQEPLHVRHLSDRRKAPVFDGFPTL